MDDDDISGWRVGAVSCSVPSASTPYFTLDACFISYPILCDPSDGHRSSALQIAVDALLAKFAAWAIHRCTWYRSLHRLDISFPNQAHYPVLLIFLNQGHSLRTDDKVSRLGATGHRKTFLVVADCGRNLVLVVRKIALVVVQNEVPAAAKISPAARLWILMHFQTLVWTLNSTLNWNSFTLFTLTLNFRTCSLFSAGELDDDVFSPFPTVCVGWRRPLCTNAYSRSLVEHGLP